MKSAFNLNPSTDHRMKLADIEHRFVAECDGLREKREETLIPKFKSFQSNFAHFAAKQSEIVNTKRVINGYDEMKMAKKEMVQKVENELIHIDSDDQFTSYLERIGKDGTTKWTLILFHRDKVEFHPTWHDIP